MYGQGVDGTGVEPLKWVYREALQDFEVDSFVDNHIKELCHPTTLLDAAASACNQ